MVLTCWPCGPDPLRLPTAPRARRGARRSASGRRFVRRTPCRRPPVRDGLAT